MKYNSKGQPEIKFGKKRSFNICISDEKGNPKPLPIKGYKVLGLNKKYPAMIIHRDINSHYKQSNDQSWTVTDHNTGLTITPTNRECLFATSRQALISAVINYLDSLKPKDLKDIKSRYNGKYPKLN